MKFRIARMLIASGAFVALGVFVAWGVSVGTWCGVGWQDVALLCPVGALLSIVASKTLIPRALVSLAAVAVLVFFLGRAFCGWLCPVPLWGRVKEFFKPTKKREAEEAALAEANREAAAAEIAVARLANGGDVKVGKSATRAKAADRRSCSSCGACSAKRNAPFDSRHAVLGGAVLTTAAFGFPVFCLICPVGLSFAAIALLIGLFGSGDLNWSLAFVPVVLVVELAFLRKWCSRLCPISALMSLVGRFSRTGMPSIDNTKCLESSKGVACGRCATVCSYDVNLRHPGLGELPVHECARCGDCVDACPAQAISFRVVNGRREPFAVLTSEADE